jgi:translocation and assembly module TamA
MPPVVVPLSCLRCAFACLIVSMLAACASPARAPEDESSDATKSGAGNDGAPPAVAYRVVIDAPDPLQEVLKRDIGLVRWQGYAEMTDDLLARLMREAQEETRYAAAAEGYFKATITVTIDRSEKPAVVTLKVVPGEPTRIASVQIVVRGPAATDTPLGTQAIAKLEREWGLPRQATFRQSAWTAAKNKALATLAASPYPEAKITFSEAAIDPDEARADLTVEIDSGPPFRFGAFEVSGLVKYPPSLAQNFNTIKRGSPYEEKELERYVRRLNGSGYFASVQTAIDTATADPGDATVKVSVIEGPPKRLEGGVGYSTDVQYRVNASYRDVNINGRGMQMLLEARYETKIQTGALRFTLPPNEARWIGAFNAGAARTDIEGLVTRTAYAGTRWYTVEERDQHALSTTFYLDEQLPSGAPTVRSHALYPEYERYWRRVDDLLSPTEGWMGVVQAGVGIPGVSTRGFGRVIGRYSMWLPLDPKLSLQMRAEAGAVLAGSRTGIPSVLLFRTGGDTTVRGYAFESLGVQEGDAIVPGRYYGLLSADLTRWIGEAWGLAAFVDAGNAVDSPSDAHLALGYGVGARVRTPLGPFRLDVAYGQDTHRFRVHFSVGLTF